MKCNVTSHLHYNIKYANYVRLSILKLPSIVVRARRECGGKCLFSGEASHSSPEEAWQHDDGRGRPLVSS
jgi:hypothetical protein